MVAVHKMGSPTPTIPVVMVSVAPVPIGVPFELHAYCVDRVSWSSSMPKAAQVSVEPTCTPVLGVMLMEENAGSRLLIALVVELVAVPPLISVVVAVQVSVSLGIASVASSVIEGPVPMIVLPLLHS